MTDSENTIPYGFCQCGCGAKTNVPTKDNKFRNQRKGIPMRFVSGHNSTGVRPGNWKEKVLNSNGYVEIHAPNNHRTQKNGRVLEHIAIVTEVLKKDLPLGAVVHHVDGDKANNAKDNLVICQNETYHRLLHSGLKAYRATGDPNLRQCSTCKEWLSQDKFWFRKDGSLVKMCKQCRKIYDAARRARTKVNCCQEVGLACPKCSQFWTCERHWGKSGYEKLEGEPKPNIVDSEPF